MEAPTCFIKAPINFRMAPNDFLKAPMNFRMAPIDFLMAPGNFVIAPIDFLMARGNFVRWPVAWGEVFFGWAGFLCAGSRSGDPAGTKGGKVHLLCVLLVGLNTNNG